MPASTETLTLMKFSVFKRLMVSYMYKILSYLQKQTWKIDLKYLKNTNATCIYVSMKRVESDSLLGYSRTDYNTLIHESIRGLRLGLWRHLATALKLCITSTFLVLNPRDSSLIGSKGFEISNLVFVAGRVRKSCVREDISLKTFTLEKKMRMITIVWSANPNAQNFQTDGTNLYSRLIKILIKGSKKGILSDT